MEKKKIKNHTILKNNRLNKGTAFTKEERDQYNLESFLPFKIETEESQLERIKWQLSRIENKLDQYIYLSNLQDRNETLFYNLLISDPNKYLPIVYDPVVGEACLKFHLIFQEPKGFYISKESKGKIKKMLQERPEKDIRFIVITDGSRILGLGDLGANGMGIPIGKSILYTAAGSIPPQHLLPVLLDMGTNNIEYLNDSFYLGMRMPRIEGEEYYSLLDEFIKAVQEVYPYCCIQFEDFANYKAIPLLKKYQNKISMFNDDIQGTGSVTLAGFYSYERITGTKISEHKVLFVGAGSAAHGIADLLCLAMEKEGLSKEKAIERCWLFDTKGLVTKKRPRLETFKEKYAKDSSDITNLLECVKKIKPTAIVGVSTQPNLFTKEIIETMAEINIAPLILPLSNPTSQEECTAEEAYKYSDGRAFFAAGVLFDPVIINNKTYYPTQANNLWIFPAIGMAAYATKAKLITEEMFIIAAQSLSKKLSEEEIEKKMLYPDESRIIKIISLIAADVAEYIFNNNLAQVERPPYDDHIIQLIEKKAYHPFYTKNEN